MSPVNREERRRHLKRVAMGSLAGLSAAFLCPLLAPELQFPCRIFVSIAYSLVAP